MSEPGKSKETSKKEFASGTIAAGGGTVLVLFANTIPDEGLRNALTALSPTVSVAFGIAFRYLWLRVEGWLQERRTMKVLLEIEQFYREKLNEADLPDEKREFYRQKLHEVEEARHDFYMARIKEIRNTPLVKPPE